VTSSLYTLGTNIANHSKMDFDPYKSSYGRHVSGKWLDPPVVFISHGVNKEFHYWKDIIEHVAPARYKTADADLNIEAPVVLKNNWVSPEEKMDEEYLKYIITEKHFAVESALQALDLINKAKEVLAEKDYLQLYNLFYRTLLTARIFESTATAYFGYRVYSRGEAFQKNWLKETIKNSLDSVLSVAGDIENYKGNVPVGQWKWKNDAATARIYYKRITETGWKEYNNIIFKAN
jgi:hypothetical protein